MLEAKRQFDKLEQEIKVQTAVAQPDGAPPIEISNIESDAPEPAPASYSNGSTAAGPSLGSLKTHSQ